MSETSVSFRCLRQGLYVSFRCLRQGLYETRSCRCVALERLAPSELVIVPYVVQSPGAGEHLLGPPMLGPIISMGKDGGASTELGHSAVH